MRAKSNQGRSLRLVRAIMRAARCATSIYRRLFKYPCSYLIYSEAFDALPKPLKKRLYTRLHQILTGKDEDADFQALPSETKEAIRKTLIDTKPDLPEFWKSLPHLDRSVPYVRMSRRGRGRIKPWPETSLSRWSNFPPCKTCNDDWKGEVRCFPPESAEPLSHSSRRSCVVWFPAVRSSLSPRE